jgi:hypothetical protein
VKRPLNRQKLVVSTGVGIGLFLILTGVRSAETGRDAQRLPDVIESINPGPGDEVLRQSQVFVDLVEGYNAELIIDGITLETTRLDELSAEANAKPGSQVNIPPTAIYDPGNFTISFLPQDGAAIEGFEQGDHRATVVYWKVTDDKSKSKSFSWEFAAN